MNAKHNGKKLNPVFNTVDNKKNFGSLATFAQ